MPEKYEDNSVPAMPCYGAYTHGEAMLTTDCGNKTPQRDGHTELIAPLGNMSDEFMAMIHTAIPDAKIWGIPKAKASVDEEWKNCTRRNVSA